MEHSGINQRKKTNIPLHKTEELNREKLKNFRLTQAENVLSKYDILMKAIEQACKEIVVYKRELRTEDRR